MKKAVNNLLFAFALPFAGITYFIWDNYRAAKKKAKNKPLINAKLHTVYPDIELNFNDWSNYIHKIQNKKQ